MTGKAAIWDLLLKHEGQWLTRPEIEKVGGLDGMRRLREIRRDALASGYAIEMKGTPGREANEYRLIRVIGMPNDKRPVCLKCGTVALLPTYRTVDTRWVKGKCVVCDDKGAIFRTAVSP